MSTYFVKVFTDDFNEEEWKNLKPEEIHHIKFKGKPFKEVQHGRWVAEDNDGSWSSAVCSVCGRRVGLTHYETDFVKHFPYCHCGAKMDGEEETSNATQHINCVENALDALDEPQKAYEQGVKDTLDKYDETCRIVSEIRMAVGCKTAKECRELIRNGEIQRVKHGKWVMNERGVYECSICGRVPTEEEKQYDRYCSWCGAKMDEVDK